MSLYSSPRHIELGGDLGVVAALQKQFNDLLLSRTEPNGLLLHHVHLFGPKFSLDRRGLARAYPVAYALPLRPWRGTESAKAYDSQWVANNPLSELRLKVTLWAQKAVISHVRSGRCAQNHTPRSRGSAQGKCAPSKNDLAGY